MAIVLLVLCALALCLAPATRAAADEFSWQLSGSFSESEVDDISESYTSSLTATYYFDAVDDTRGPYALAAFYDPATQVSAAMQRSEETSDVIQYTPGTSLSLPGSESKANEYTISGRYLLPQSKWYFGGRHMRGDLDEPPELSVLSADQKSYGVIAGKYLGAATTLELAVDRSQTESVRTFILCVVTQYCANAGEMTFASTTDTLSLEVLHVRRFRSLTYALSGGITETSLHVVLDTPAFTLPAIPPILGPIDVPASTTAVEPDPFYAYSVSAELFPTAKLGVRLGYTRFDGDSVSDHAYDLATTWYFRRNVGLQFLFSRQEAESLSSFETDGAALRVIGRF